VQGVVEGATGWAGRRLPGAAVGNPKSPDYKSASFGNKLVSGAAGAIVGAAARSLIDGTDFGDNIAATLPAAIGATIGNRIGITLTAKGAPRAGKDLSTGKVDPSTLQNPPLAIAGDTAPLISQATLDANGKAAIANLANGVPDLTGGATRSVSGGGGRGRPTVTLGPVEDAVAGPASSLQQSNWTQGFNVGDKLRLKGPLGNGSEGYVRGVLGTADMPAQYYDNYRKYG
jgi:hypothetical protein